MSALSYVPGMKWYFWKNSEPMASRRQSIDQKRNCLLFFQMMAKQFESEKNHRPSGRLYITQSGSEIIFLFCIPAHCRNCALPVLPYIYINAPMRRGRMMVRDMRKSRLRIGFDLWGNDMEYFWQTVQICTVLFLLPAWILICGENIRRADQTTWAGNKPIAENS